MRKRNKECPPLMVHLPTDTMLTLVELAQLRGMAISELVKNFINLGIALQKPEKTKRH